MVLRMEPGQIYNSWEDFRFALEEHSKENKVLFNIGHAKTVEQANNLLKKPPFFQVTLKYASCVLRCKHYGSYTSLSSGLRPKQRSYKIDCRAFISVSACRKAGYLIVRDSYHLHSHPCTEEMYNSYPEVRRMSKDEKKMVGTLMDIGVPVAQIKTAIGRSITPKDLHNARSHIKRIKSEKKRYSEIESVHNTSSDMSGDDVAEFSPMKKFKYVNGDDHEKESEASNETANTDFSMLVTGMEMEGHQTEMTASQSNSRMITGEVETDTSSLSGLLTTAGLSSESVVLTVNQGSRSSVLDEAGKVDIQPKNSYTVTVSLPDRDVTHTGTDLQELLKGLPLKGLEANKEDSSNLSNATTIVSEGSSKKCLQCNMYMSPLDGHSLCLQCLGPDHLMLKSCILCNAMRPEQLSIRRKQLVRQRMKALKALQEKKRNNSASPDSNTGTTRKSQRSHKPKNNGPDIAVESTDLKGYASEKANWNDTVKCEPQDQYQIPDATKEAAALGRMANSQRFEHLVCQASLMEDVHLEESSDGSLKFLPDASISREFCEAMGMKNPLATPTSLDEKYLLHQRFESKYCSEASSVPHSTDPGVRALSDGLGKLTKNAMAQTRLALYDKLFTRLGVSMADEALSILGDLYGRVTHVTEISQDDLTSDLQTALDTIQALKDVLEELGVMSSDAISTAALQRSISINSLNNAKKYMNQKVGMPDIKLPGVTRRRKFQPFSRPTITSTDKLGPEHLTSSVALTSLPEMSLPSQYMKHLVVNVSTKSEQNSSSCLPVTSVNNLNTEHTHSPVCGDARSNLSDKDFSMELLHTLQGGKDNIIELVQDRKDGVMELIQGKKSVMQLHQGSKELLQTLQGGNEVIEFHEQQEITQRKENMIEYHVVKDVGNHGQLMTSSRECIHESIQSQSGEIHLEAEEAYHLTR